MKRERREERGGSEREMDEVEGRMGGQGPPMDIGKEEAGGGPSSGCDVGLCFLLAFRFCVCVCVCVFVFSFPF